MNDDKILIEALRRLSVQTGSIACLGCESAPRGNGLKS